MKATVAAVAILFASVQPFTTAAQTPVAAGNEVTRTYRLNSAGMSTTFGIVESNELLTALRNVLPPSTRIILIPNQNAVVVVAAPEVQATMVTLLRDLDKPHAQYRLTYTFTESEGGKRVGLQHYSMMLTSGQRMQMKQGSRVPVNASSRQSGADQQNTYIDVGLNFDSTVQEYGAGLQLKSKVERTALAEEAAGQLTGMPLIRQTLLEGVALLSIGKPASLGSIDLPGSIRHLDVEATLEPAK